MSRRLLRRRCAGLVLVCGLAVAARGHGADPEKLEELAAALRRAPDDPALLVAQARLLVEHGDHGVARRNLDRVDALAPGAYPTDDVRGLLLFDEGDLSGAADLLDRAVLRAPAEIEPRLWRARVRRALGRRDAALEDYLAVWRATSRPTGDLTLEVAEALVAGGRTADAAAVLQRGIASVGQVPSLLVRLIDLEVARGRPADALPWAEAMQSRSARPEPWMARRAELLELAGRADEARAAWTQLDAHLARLPNLERGSPALRPVVERVARARASSVTPISPVR